MLLYRCPRQRFDTSRKKASHTYTRFPESNTKMAQSCRRAREKPSPTDSYKQTKYRDKPLEWSIVQAWFTRRKFKTGKSSHNFVGPCCSATLASTAHTTAYLAAVLRGSALAILRSLYHVTTIPSIKVSTLFETDSDLSHINISWLSHNIRQLDSSSMALSSLQRYPRRFLFGAIYPRCWRFCDWICGRYS